ncbi:MAG: type II toxin-antitoxin system RelE/ParE family toxin [Planctomycetota bacterium]|jgi:mRNA-degrading endonuclease RelE of RelBE toxin-antitoxin system
MKVFLLPPADRELKEAVEFYEDQLIGLGQNFFEEFDKTIQLVCELPYGWRKVGKNTRRINIKRFPYLVLYVIEDDTILVTCISHSHRDPNYYIDKIN